jgi:hypothetical protein
MLDIILPLHWLAERPASAASKASPTARRGYEFKMLLKLLLFKKYNTTIEKAADIITSQLKEE